MSDSLQTLLDLEAIRSLRILYSHHLDGNRLDALNQVCIKGNTHFPFSDLNNLQIADLMSKFLHENKLDE